jgi:ketopantoate reductase
VKYSDGIAVGEMCMAVRSVSCEGGECREKEKSWNMMAAVMSRVAVVARERRVRRLARRVQSSGTAAVVKTGRGSSLVSHKEQDGRTRGGSREMECHCARTGVLEGQGW